MKQLSIEELRRKRSEAFFMSGKDKSNEEVIILDELIAIREAQGVPVACTGEDLHTREDFVTLFKEIPAGTDLFTAPQLPVVPEGWHFERCEHDECNNGAIVNVGSAPVDKIHLCAECSHLPQYKNLKVKALPKRLSAAPKPGGALYGIT